MPAQRIFEFDTWRPGYGGATVIIYRGGTTTLAAVFKDEALTIPAENPQELLTDVDNNISYGKFAERLYTAEAYSLDIDGTDQTGIQRPPLTTLDGQDATNATVRANGGTRDVALEDIVARVVYATDYGALAGVAATNTTTLTAAISAAASRGGGMVVIPAGTYPFNQLSVPDDVVLHGAGRGVTTLQSDVAGAAITFSGDRAGLSHLTLDGVDLSGGSIGVLTKGRNETVFDDVEIMRFETGIHAKGGRRSNWRELYITNAVNGAKLHGDSDAGSGGSGDQYRENSWIGGMVQQCTTVGVHLSWEDLFCINNLFQDVGFEDNTGVALRLNGARYTQLSACWFRGNTGAVAAADDADTTNTARRENTVIGLFFMGGEIDGGTATFTGTCENVILQGMNLKDVDFTLSVPIRNPILVRDCSEDAQVTLAGDATKYRRFARINEGQSTGVTVDATATKAWSIELAPGQVVYLEGIVIGRQRNGTGDAYYHLGVSAHRPGSTLAYDSQTANYTPGNMATGASSGATARIRADSDSGATGTLTLIDIDGAFIDNEVITDTGGGSALVNGTLAHQNAALKGSVAAIRAAQETDAAWDATFVANGPEIELRVTGEAAKTIEWEVFVHVVSN